MTGTQPDSGRGDSENSQPAPSQTAPSQTAPSEPVHSDWDCSHARMQLYEYLDGEMAPDDIRKIREHLDHCAPCLQEYDLDQTLKALIRRSCGCEAAPRALRMQILARITTIKMTVEFRD